MSVQVSIDGSAGFVGALANFLKLNKKNFRGALTAQADISLGVNEDWCPTVTATPDFSWSDKAQLEVAGKLWINVRQSSWWRNEKSYEYGCSENSQLANLRTNQGT